MISEIYFQNYHKYEDICKAFSFNVDGGRCETCNKEGSINVEMVFMADAITL
jgi:excinuclease UvrABC ATPase subunit